MRRAPRTHVRGTQACLDVIQPWLARTVEAARDERLALLGAPGVRPHRVPRDGTCAPADEASAVRAARRRASAPAGGTASRGPGAGILTSDAAFPTVLIVLASSQPVRIPVRIPLTARIRGA